MEDLSTESIVVGVGNNNADLDSANLETNGNCKADDEVNCDNSADNGLNSVDKSSSSVGGDADSVRGIIDADTGTDTNANRPSPAPKKGYGLKKWRRIRRSDHHVGTKTDTGTSTGMEKEKEYDSDSTGRRQKRGPANLLNENEKEGSLNSIKNTAATTAEAASNSFVAPAAALFNAGVDSDNSEDSISISISHSHSHSHSHRSSSKSSTAATSKLRSSSKHRTQLAKPIPNVVVVEKSKKSKGGLELERENENSPRSSMDSDSLSSNSVFFRGSSDHASNSLPNPAPDSLDQARQTPAADAAHSPDSSDQLSSTANNHKDHQLLGDGNGDPFNESILMLQSVKLALQAEVQKFGEIGKGICSLCDDSDKTSGIPVSSMLVDPGLSEFNHAYLSKIIQTLESQLNEAEGRLKEKDLKIAESETTMRNLEAHHDLTRRALEQQYRRCTELEDHLLDLFMEKVEAEIKSVVMTRSTKDSFELLEDRKKLMGEQKSVPWEATQTPKMEEDVENKIAMQQGQAEKLDTHNISKVDGNEEILKMQRGVAKLRNRLFIQLVLLGFVIALFFLQLGPKSTVVVPT